MSFDTIVIGGGHAAIEAGLASARLGLRTLMLVMDLDSIGLLACNPSIGGTAKGNLVKEIDALGGEMGVLADKTMLQLRMLNSSKGVAVRSLRAQIDKYKYHTEAKRTLENTKNLTLRQAEAAEILTADGTPSADAKRAVTGVKTVLGQSFFAPNVIVCTGVYLNAHIIVGHDIIKTGPAGFSGASALSKSLARLGHGTRRFKTGTPARINGKTADYSALERQDGENVRPFSAMSGEVNYAGMPCYLGYTNEATHDVIRKNLRLAPMYSGLIEGVGARYCPSIEDKIVRFADKKRHQFFLEPEGADTVETYVQGISTGLPPDVQLEILRTIKGLENVEIMRDAYAIEYDCVDSLTLDRTLMSKTVSGLFFAGQINGTSGYEEAAAQGLMAGINCAMRFQKRPPLVLPRSSAYIGVLIDDLSRKGTNEPYRMMTSRAEYRLRLRQSNSDLRLTELGRDAGLVTDARYEKYLKRKNEIEEIQSLLGKSVPADVLSKIAEETGEGFPARGTTLRELFRRPGIEARHVSGLEFLKRFSPENLEQVVYDCRYEGYYAREDRDITEAARLEKVAIPDDFSYASVKGLRIEAREKLSKLRPGTIGAASRISGVNPADITVLLLSLKSKEKA